LTTETAAPKPIKNGAGKPAPVKGGPAMPANGIELQRRVHDYDARLAQQSVCQRPRPNTFNLFTNAFC